MNANEIIEVANNESDRLMQLVMSTDLEAFLITADPGELVQMLGATASVVRFGSMFTAQIADRLTQIAAEAAGG